jgi:hypothetical protein
VPPRLLSSRNKDDERLSQLHVKNYRPKQLLYYIAITFTSSYRNAMITTDLGSCFTAAAIQTQPLTLYKP